MKFSYVSLRTAVAVSAASAMFVMTVLTGMAQQPPVGAPGAQPPAAPGAPAAPGRGAGGPGGGAGAAGAPAVDGLGAGPWEYGGGRGRGGRGGGGGYRVTVVARGLDTPWGIAFVPNGDILVTERSGNLRVIRNGVLDPMPISGVPAVISNPGQLGGLLDVILHPKFAENRWIYLAYSKQDPDPAKCPNRRQTCSATLAVARAKWDGGSALTDVKDIIVTKGWHGGPGTDQSTGPASGSFGSRFAWDKDGLLFITSGDRNLPSSAQDPQSHNGKILRLRDDGSVPADNPFVKDKRYLPEIYSLGHRNPLGLYVHPVSGELWETEEGPQGGDELNVIKAGKNYGWPEVGLGRHYSGEPMAKGFSAPGFEEPLVFWVPAIANSGLSIYNGEKFPQWKGNAFVGAMRGGTGQYLVRVQFNEKGLPTGRDNMLADLRQRIREAKPSPDGFIYVLTDVNPGHVLRIEPMEAQAPAGGAPGGAPGGPGGGGRRGGGAGQ